MAGAQVTVAASCIEKQRLGYQSISLTNFTSDTLEPQIADGSKVEIGGSLFEFAANESITGWAGIANNSDVYILLTVTGASVAASFSTTAPTWSTSKQGWYTAAVRVIGGLRKDSGGNYAQKWLYEEQQVASVKRYGSGAVVLAGALTVTGAATLSSTLAITGAVQMGSADTAMYRKVIDIGDWDMDATEIIGVAHGVTYTKIRSISVLIRADNGQLFPFGLFNGAVCGDVYTPTGGTAATHITLRRVTGGAYDSTSFDATSYNRGWIIIEYTA